MKPILEDDELLAECEQDRRLEQISRWGFIAFLVTLGLAYLVDRYLPLVPS